MVRGITKIGFVGFGSMATMLINGLIEKAGISASGIIVARKDKSRITQINDAFPNIHTAYDASEVAGNANLIFVCVKPMDVQGALLEMQPFITKDTHLVSVTGIINLSSILSIADCKISKLIPTIVSEIGEGIILVCHNASVKENDKQLLYQYIEKLGRVKTIDEKDIAFAAELTSCNPGFIASIFDNMIKVAHSHTSSFTIEEITEMVMYTAYATSKLLHEKRWDYSALIKRVATKGGVTEEGVVIFDKMLPSVYEAMFNQTLGKRALLEKRFNDDFTTQE
jgi:pyrroline-5-carboxylate reductase